MLAELAPKHASIPARPSQARAPAAVETAVTEADPNAWWVKKK
jgi:hypothetical protein